MAKPLGMLAGSDWWFVEMRREKRERGLLKRWGCWGWLWPFEKLVQKAYTNAVIELGREHRHHLPHDGILGCDLRLRRRGKRPFFFSLCFLAFCLTVLASAIQQEQGSLPWNGRPFWRGIVRVMTSIRARVMMGGPGPFCVFYTTAARFGWLSPTRLIGQDADLWVSHCQPQSHWWVRGSGGHIAPVESRGSGQIDSSSPFWDRHSWFGDSTLRAQIPGVGQVACVFWKNCYHLRNCYARTKGIFSC
ncbi:hypothetical protein QBC37DRAFT_157921 [Rhypophila decipiens]|uniref:Uncharacterized protein n=1 Tax=Rhypophila decipiens TaxID=261697 RepID=A0AAN6Y8M9_9PEZI|nr:hypothetical protein QBC37DRAFT_157921 [Rhypophila decipiens]